MSGSLGPMTSGGGQLAVVSSRSSPRPAETAGNRSGDSVIRKRGYSNRRLAKTMPQEPITFQSICSLLWRADSAPMIVQGNVHSAVSWQEVLEPVVARYERTRVRRYFRADAAFASPEVYECLEEHGFLYATRLPSDDVLEGETQHLLKRPWGDHLGSPLSGSMSFSIRQGAGIAPDGWWLKWSGTGESYSPEWASSWPICPLNLKV